MFGINYFKAEPNEFARISVGGKVKKEGKGVSCFYLPFRTSVELVRVAATDQPFVFTEITKDKQEISIQGGLVYKIADPKQTLGVFDFTIDPHTKQYLTEGGEKFSQALVHLVQDNARRMVQGESLETLLVSSEVLSGGVLDSLRASDTVREMGVKMQMLYFSSIRPSPEIEKALGTTYREALLQKADEAVYARRALAVEKERAIEQNELATKIELEARRKEFVDLEGRNIIQQAEFRAAAAKKELEVYEGLDPATLTAHGIYQIGKNASRIGTLMITPDMLTSMMNTGGKGKGEGKYGA